MTTTMQSAADKLNVTKNVGDSPIKRTIAKLRHPMRAELSSSAAEKAFDSHVDENEEAHVTTGEYATSATHALTREVGQYWASPAGDADMRKIFTSLLKVLYDIGVELLLSEELQTTARMAGRESVLGAWEGLEKKLSTQLEKLPKVITLSILPLSAVFVGLFMLGLLLALWRFALFGLHS